jgi:chemotaxis protein CheD
MTVPCKGKRIVKVGPGEHHVTDLPEVAIATVLGSCVAACICDPVVGVGGLNHFMLPESIVGTWGQATASLRYGNFAMQRLINDILMRGGQRSRLEIKLFGGGTLAQDYGRIGERNADFVESYLRAEGLVPLVRQLRGQRARRVLYYAVSGRALMQELPDQDPQAGVSEGHLGATLQRRLGFDALEFVQ